MLYSKSILNKFRYLIAGAAVFFMTGLSSSLLFYYSTEYAFDIKHTYQTTHAIEKISLILTKASNDARGFALSGMPQFLERYNRNVYSLPMALDDLQTLVKNNKAQSSQLEAMLPKVHERMKLLARLVQMRKEKGLEACINEIRSLKKIEIMSSFKPFLNAMRKEEEHLLEKYLENYRWTIFVNIIAAFAGSFISLLFLCIGAVEIKRRLEAQKLAEKALKESEARFRQLADAMPQIVFAHLADGSLYFINARWYQYTGRPQIKAEQADTEFLFEEVFNTNDIKNMVATWINNVNTKEFYQNEIRLKDALGNYRWFLTRIVPIKNENGDIIRWFTTCTDIDDYKRIEKERIARKAADAANNAKSEFIASMSHEIRTPLGIVLGYAEILCTNHVSAVKKVQYAKIILNNGKSLLALLNDILDFSKVENGHLTIENSKLLLKPFILEILLQIRLKTQEKGLELKHHFAQNVPKTVITDGVRLRQILLNLLWNAVKFTDQGSIYLEISYSQTGDLIFSIADTGCGIAEDKQEEIFEPFTQANSSLAKKLGGTGLGLSLSRKLARALGGNVRLSKSAPGYGSQFLITVNSPPSLELLESVKGPSKDESSQSLQKKIRNDSDLPLKDVHILLAEDLVDNQLLIKIFLNAAGAHVDIAADGDQALNLALQKKYQLILMDIEMPKKNGHEVTLLLREHGLTLPIIALTAHAMESERRKCFGEGFCDYVTKPISHSELIQKIQKYLHSSFG